MTDNGANGVIRKTGDGYEIVFTRRFGKPIHKVWAALTVPERIADWFTEMRFIPDVRLGARVELFFPDDDPPFAMTKGEVVSLEPPRLFAWTWPDDDHPNSVIRCELAPDGDGCVLTFSQSGLGAKHLTSVAAGWHVFLDGLGGAADGVHTHPAASSAKRRCGRATRRSWRRCDEQPPRGVGAALRPRLGMRPIRERAP